MVSKRTYLVILFGAGTWSSLIILAPLLSPLGGLSGVVAESLYKFFHPICHQLDERSFHVVGKPLGVCIRCSSVYFAFLVGTILYPFMICPRTLVRSELFLLICGLIPMLLDVALDALGLHSSTTLTRVVTGALFGFVVPHCIIPAAQEAIREFIASSFHRYPELKKGLFHA